MTATSFHPRFEELSPTLPVFPLTGVLLLPRGLLPLNIFEARYIAMVDDALSSDRMIGMVQPVDPHCRAHAPALYRLGCAGRITSFEETDDGRYLITLCGICRFRIAEELEKARGYRRVSADWSCFPDDLGEPPDLPVLDRDRMDRALGAYFERHGISANWQAIAQTPDERLVTSLSMICPFEPPEKQALLEAPTLAGRAEMLLSLIEMAVLDNVDEPARH